MGFGTRAMKLLVDYYTGKFSEPASGESAAPLIAKNGVPSDAESADLLHEIISPHETPLPLLSELSEREHERVDYIGVCFGLTEDLLRYTHLT
jgi:N-acetyltransferase 10